MTDKPVALRFRIKLEFGNVGFLEEGKARVPGEKPLGARTRTNNKLKPHGSRRRVLLPLCHPWSTKSMTIICTVFFVCLGALFVRNPKVVTPLYPMFYGGGQERNFRPGTENTGMIAGLGQAAQLVLDNLNQYHNNMKMVSE